MKKLEKVIKKLCEEKGYPHQKLTFSEYYQVLKKAHAKVFGTKPH